MEFNFFKKNKWFILLFLISTSFFIYQHATHLPWDFSAYVLNAKYLFDNGSYFEPFRPPLVPFFIGLFGFLGWKFAEYAYIIFVSTIFLISSIKLAESLKFNKLYFYAISLNVYVLLFGLLEGSELLSLAFLELFISYLLKNKHSGHFLGLASLSRYNFLILFPLLIFYKDIKKILKNLILFTAVLIPWFVYNFAKYGNFFMSIADLYAINIYFRKGYLFKPFNFYDLIFATNFMLPFILIGLFSVLCILYKKSIKIKFRIFYEKKAEIIMIILLIFSLWNYYNIPNKTARYLFPLMLPCFYFSYVGLMKISFLFSNRKNKKEFILKKLIILFIIINLILLFYVGSSYRFYKSTIYQKSIKQLEELTLNNRSLMSNGWVPINYFGRPCKPFIRKELVNKRINEGEIILLFPHIGEPNYTRNETFINELPIIFRNKDYIILGDKTKYKKITIENRTFIKKINDGIFEAFGYNITTDPCVILFDNSILTKICYFVNFKHY